MSHANAWQHCVTLGKASDNAEWQEVLETIDGMNIDLEAWSHDE